MCNNFETHATIQSSFSAFCNIRFTFNVNGQWSKITYIISNRHEFMSPSKQRQRSVAAWQLCYYRTQKVHKPLFILFLLFSMFIFSTLFFDSSLRQQKKCYIWKFNYFNARFSFYCVLTLNASEKNNTTKKSNCRLFRFMTRNAFFHFVYKKNLISLPKQICGWRTTSANDYFPLMVVRCSLLKCNVFFCVSRWWKKFIKWNFLLDISFVSICFDSIVCFFISFLCLKNKNEMRNCKIWIDEGKKCYFRQFYSVYLIWNIALSKPPLSATTVPHSTLIIEMFTIFFY